MLKKGTAASPATAFASNVLPVPGGPTKSTPFGILAPISVYFLGFLRKSTSSATSSFSSSSPATSLKVVDPLSSIVIFALLLPNDMTRPPPPPPPCICCVKNTIMKINIPTTSTICKIGINILGSLYSDGTVSVLKSSGGNSLINVWNALGTTAIDTGAMLPSGVTFTNPNEVSTISNSNFEISPLRMPVIKSLYSNVCVSST